MPPRSDLSITQAKERARALWPGVGGTAWTNNETSLCCLVGIQLATAKGFRRQVLGRGVTFLKAFESAERRARRALENGNPAPRRRARKGRPGALPQLDLPFPNDAG